MRGQSPPNYVSLVHWKRAVRRSHGALEQFQANMAVRSGKARWKRSSAQHFDEPRRLAPGFAVRLEDGLQA